MSDPVRAAEEALAAHRPAEAVALAQAAAASDHPGALALLASWHLVGAPLPRDLPAARALLARARQQGDEWATFTEIALTANGTGAAPDWPGALALLRAAAARSPLAAEDLALLEAMDLDAAGFPRTRPPGELLARSPQIAHLRQFLTPDECVHLVNVAQPLLEPSAVVDPISGRLTAHPIRTSSAATLGPVRETLPIQAIQRRIARASGIPANHGEPLVVLRYAPGEQYRMHLDTLPNAPNQRVMTVLLYLNHGYAGGETRFEGPDFAVTGRQGDAVMFANVLPDGRPDPRSRHAGLPVTAGTKWLATRWVRARPLDVWSAATGGG